ncbi:conserved hypothetical protein [Cupriavidus taiwanensis]|uniref:hypothetical protein n=1 Tax=Cupriavidus taiwanensis TaxID=164546 RepID=UPI000E1900CE|nr:hypothetical protein [Cupriavidus taiwanensis]SPA24581.1 conserved hypothetical protein [Cupriavidus taiwanensis]
MRIQTIRLPDVKEGVRYLSDLVYTLMRILTEIATQLNNLSEGRITAATNASTAPPTTGEHQVGDYVRNSAPAELGTAGSKYVIEGWLCTVAGTPGTWVQKRCLTGN